jgi:hypothetical protein
MTTPDSSSSFYFLHQPRELGEGTLTAGIVFAMPAFSRGLRALALKGDFVCSRCLQFSTTSAAQSGHNRWSKIKHDKGAVDAKKNVQRSEFSRSIAFASKSKAISCTYPEIES